MNILGVSCFYHDSAACLIRDGKVIAAASEERFNRKKNTSDFPIKAINFCLQAGQITVDDLDYIAFYEKPFLKFHRVILSHLQAYPFSFKNFYENIPQWLSKRLAMPVVFNKELAFDGQTLFVKHHLSHAASAFLVSPFENSAILTADAVGEWATLSYGAGSGTDIRISKEMHFPNSLGLLYTAVTTYLGFRAHEGEGKVMGLAGYGKPRYVDKLRQIVKVCPDGSFMLDRSFFGFVSGSRMYNGKFLKLFGPEREPDSEIQERHCDMAASIQQFTEDILIKICCGLYENSKVDNLSLAGGLFLNCVANARILEKTPFKKIFIQPAAGDSGGALGAAAYIYHCLLGFPRHYVLESAYFGPEYSEKSIKSTLINRGLGFKELDDRQLSRYIAEKISQNKIVGWFQGRMEFGPRALGNRSILANPANPDMKEILNSKVKKRESFRPYAPAVLEERANDFFSAGQFSPFMLIAARVRDDKKKLIPAVTHVDGTARVQTVSCSTNPKFWQLIRDFEDITGIPMVINTSFNVGGEPMVCAPSEAIEDFLRTEMDILVLDKFILEK